MIILVSSLSVFLFIRARKLKGGASDGYYYGNNRVHNIPVLERRYDTSSDLTGTQLFSATI